MTLNRELHSLIHQILSEIELQGDDSRDACFGTLNCDLPVKLSAVQIP